MTTEITLFTARHYRSNLLVRDNIMARKLPQDTKVFLILMMALAFVPVSLALHLDFLFSALVASLTTTLHGLSNGQPWPEGRCGRH